MAWHLNVEASSPMQSIEAFEMLACFLECKECLMMHPKGLTTLLYFLFVFP